MAKTRQGNFFSSYGTATFFIRFKQEDSLATLRQKRCCTHAVNATANNYRVKIAHDLYLAM